MCGMNTVSLESMTGGVESRLEPSCTVFCCHLQEIE